MKEKKSSKVTYTYSSYDPSRQNRIVNALILEILGYDLKSKEKRIKENFYQYTVWLEKKKTSDKPVAG